MALQVDIVSDVVCPWCWLGKKRLEAAVDLVGEPVEIIWRPYELDPLIPEEGQNYRDYMRAKFGAEGSDRFKPMRDHLEAAAPDAGITFRFDEIRHRPNTLNAHRLIRWAQGQGQGDAAVEALFKAFFDDLRDIGDLKTLAAIGGEIGLDREILSGLLSSDKDKQQVREEETVFRQMGVSGVPTFIFAGRYGVSGAQEPEELAKMIGQALTAQ